MSKRKNKTFDVMPAIKEITKNDLPPPKAQRWKSIEEKLNKKMKYVLGAILLSGILIRLVYFIQLNSTPCINYHLYDQSDMNFFDRWAKHLSTEDWMQHTSYNNYTSAHKWISEAYLNNHPEKMEELKKLLPEGSAGDFKDYARALFNKWQGDKIYFQEPFYVYFVAVVYKIFGPDVRFVFLFQLLIGLASLTLIFIITRNYFGNIAALCASIIGLLHGPLLFYELILLRESIIVFAGLLLVYTISRTMKNKSGINLLLTGIIIGLCLLVKSIFAIFALLFLALLFFDSRKKKEAMIKSMLIPVAGVLIGMLPLIIRNVIVGITPFAIASSGTFSFVTCNYYGYNPELGFALNTTLEKIFYKTDGAFLPSVIEVLKTFPSFSDYLVLLWHKFKVIFLWVEIPNNKSYYYFALNAPVLNFTFINFSAIAALGIPGIVLSFFRKEKPFGLYVLVFTHLAVLLGFLVLSRYRIPFAAALLPFCGLAISEFFKKVERNDMRLLMIALPAAALFFIVNRTPAEAVTPIRSSDYVTSYYYYYQPRIDTAMQNNRYSDAMKLMETFFMIKPGGLDALNENTPKANNNQLNLASAYAPIYKKYSMIAAANKQNDEALKYKQREEALTNISDRLGTATDAAAMIKKARLSNDGGTKKFYLDKAVAELKLHLKASPSDLNSIAAIADIMINDFHDSTQYEFYTEGALKIYPDNPNLQFNLGHYYMIANKNMQVAKELVEKSLRGLPNNSAAYNDLGYYYVGNKRYDKAREMWLMAIQINPADSNAVRNLRILNKFQHR